MGYKTKAKCPKCGKEYIALLPCKWNGRGILRRFCSFCRKSEVQGGLKVTRVVRR